MDFNTMHVQRKMILIASAIGVISVFLPWFSSFGFSINALHDVGILILLGYAAGVTFSLVGDQKTQMPTNFWMFALIGGALACLITLITFLRMAGVGAMAFIGFGLWISLAASGFLVFVAWKHKKQEDTIQSGFNSIFNQSAKTGGDSGKTE